MEENQGSHPEKKIGFCLEFLAILALLAVLALYSGFYNFLATLTPFYRFCTF